MLLAATAFGLVATPPGRTTRRSRRSSTRPSSALGGEEKLAKADAATWKAKAKITIEGNENEMSSEGTVQGIDHFRSEFEGEFNGNNFKGVTVLNGDKGWRKFGEMVMELDGDAAREREADGLPGRRPTPRSCRSRPRTSRSRLPARRR